MDPRLEDAVRRARAGDPRAFRTLAEHLGPDLVRFVSFYLHGDVHAAHDVAQDTLVRAWDALAGIEDAAHLRRWCYKVARCKAVSWLRRRGPPGLARIEALEASGAPPARGLRDHDPPPDATEGETLRELVRRAVGRLPPQYAGAVHLHYVQGCTTRETADLLGLTRGGVKMRLLRARAFLRREIHRHMAEPPVRTVPPRRRSP